MSALLSSSSSSLYCEQSSRLGRLELNTIIEECPEEQQTEHCRGRTGISRNALIGSPTLSTSTISSYYQRSRGSREFDDLYDATDSESDQDSIEIPHCHTRPSSKNSVQSKKLSLDVSRKNRYPTLVIPSPTSWPTIEKFQQNSALALARSTTIPLAPEVLAKLNGEARTSSNLPSLDGSLLSEHLANSSSPATPKESNHLETIKNWQRMLTNSIYSSEDIEFEQDNEDRHAQHSSMLLSPEAFDVLQSLSHEQEVEETQQQEMQEICVWAEPSLQIEAEPMSAISEFSISQISLPSPGAMFSSESADAAWFTIAPVIMEPASPTFSSIEEFYNSSCSQALTRSPAASPKLDQFYGSFCEPLIEPQMVELLDILEQEPTFSTTGVVDRTSNWLSAQNEWLASLREDTPVAKAPEMSTALVQSSMKSVEITETPVKRTVHFDDTVESKASETTSESKGDALFYHAFQRLSLAASPTDSFVHRHSRFDAIQAQRTSLQVSYVNSLLGDYRLATVYRPAPHRPISMMPSNEPENNLDDEEKQYFSTIEREREATEQLAPAMWVVEALRYLSGGSLFNSPVADQLSIAPPLDTAPLPSHVRVLDLGGAPQCDWAWHCARDYPQVKTYTAILHSQPHNPSLHGPSNHRLVCVDNFFTLPFPSNHFDAISARSLAMYLKTIKPLGSETDEYDLCLQECLRVLKPGGYLEFFLLDADIVTSTSNPAALSNATPAPLASKLSVEFSFSLTQHGYDATPSKSFLARLRRNGFSSIKRAWMFLPIGGETEVLSSMPETPPPSGASVYDEGIFSRSIEAVQGPVGCTQDAAAVSGLVGGWMWESWVVKLAREMGRDGFSGLVGDVAGVVEEGRKAGGGWRVLRGWGRKPL